MSWTKITCLFSFCALLAAPVMAQPSLSVELSGGATPTLDANGGFVWSIGVNPDESQFATPADGDNAGVRGASVALDVGFDLTGGLSANAAARTVSTFDTATPGNSFFGDETADGDGDFIGVQIGSDVANVFASAGSIYLASDSTTDLADVTEALRITTAAVNTDNLTTSVSWGGAYDATGAAGSTHGAVAQGGSYNNQIGVQGSADFTAIVGDVNLDGVVNGTDLGILSGNWLGTGGFWGQGNFNNQTDNVVNGTDLGILSGNWLGTSGAGAVSAGQIPEPSSVILVLMGLAVGAGVYRARS